MGYAPRFNAEIALQTLEHEFAQNPSLDLKELKNRHGRLIRWVKRYVGEKERERFTFFVREAIKNTLRNRWTNGEELRKGHIHIQDRVLATEVEWAYPRNNGVSSWRLAVIDSGIAYVPRKCESLTLEGVLSDLSKIVNSIQDFNYDQIFNTDKNLPNRAQRVIGNLGKAAILLGLDIMKGKAISKTPYVFSQDDVDLIVNSSISFDEKTRLLFNALALQYYNGFDTAKSKNYREVDSIQRGRIVLRQDQFAYCKISTRLETRGSGLYNMIMHLDPDLENRLHHVDFYFDRKPAESVAQEFYDNIGKTLATLRARAKQKRADKEKV